MFITIVEVARAITVWVEEIAVIPRVTSKTAIESRHIHFSSLFTKRTLAIVLILILGIIQGKQSFAIPFSSIDTTDQTQSAFATEPILKIDTEIDFESTSKKTTTKTKKSKLTKANGDVIETEEVTVTIKDKHKKGGGKLKGEIDPALKTGKVNLLGTISGELSTEIEISLLDGTVSAHSFDNVPFVESFSVDMFLDSGIVTFFNVSGTSILRSFDFPEIGFETGIATIRYSDTAAILDLFLDASFPFQIGSTVAVEFATNEFLNFENISQTLVLSEISTNTISVVSEPPSNLIVAGCIVVFILLRHRNGGQKWRVRCTR